MHVQKQLFAERLSRASEELKEQGERGSPPRQPFACLKP